MLCSSAGIAKSQGRSDDLRAAATGGLRVNERLATSDSVYAEGAYQYISVHAARNGRQILERRFVLGTISLARRLAPGSYRLRSWTQSCSGNCSMVDPPSHRCSRVVRLSRGAARRVTVLSKVGERCRIAVR